MRIIAGLYRGKKLFSPLSNQIRPTADRARESVFNILSSKISEPWDQIRLADIFAGTGAFGFEAISRGAKSVTFVDIDTSTATKNSSLFPNEKSKITILKTDACRLPVASAPFDIIFIDAPYHQELSVKALGSILTSKWLAKDGICIVETAADEELPIPQNLKLTDTRRYGIAKFYFLQPNL